MQDQDMQAFYAYVIVYYSIALLGNLKLASASRKEIRKQKRVNRKLKRQVRKAARRNKNAIA